MSLRRRTLALVLPLLAPLAACGPSLEDAAACDVDDFEVVYAFAGPGWSAGALSGEPQSEYVAHATLAATKPEQHASFVAMMTSIQEQMLASDGLVAFSWGHSESCGTARTVGVWIDAASIDAFAHAGAHAAGVNAFGSVATAGATGRWTVTADQLPLTIDDGRGHLGLD